MMAFAELLNDKVVFAKGCKLSHELAADFISNSLKTTWILLNKEIPQEVNMASLRDIEKLGIAFKKLRDLRSSSDVNDTKTVLKKLHFKFALLHDMLRIVDVFLFPNFVPCHTDGVPFFHDFFIILH